MMFWLQNEKLINSQVSERIRIWGNSSQIALEEVNIGKQKLRMQIKVNRTTSCKCHCDAVLTYVYIHLVIWSLFPLFDAIL